VLAACSIANIVKSSLGPVGLDKMLVDDIGVSKYITFDELYSPSVNIYFLVKYKKKSNFYNLKSF
jgi:chaperonin GroEL (HSP60 family)